MAAVAEQGNLHPVSTAFKRGVIKSPALISITDALDNARPQASDLPFDAVTPTELADIAHNIKVALDDIKAQNQDGLIDRAIPWVGLPETFWYWTQTMKHYNKRLILMPAAISEPRNVEELKTAVVIAKMAGAKVQARSGGHSYGGYGWGGKDGSFCISMSNFDAISVDKDNKTATIGVGALLGDVNKALDRKGFMTPHGICPQVGVGGHCTIGGQGPSSRMYGMLLDQIISFDIVLADGSYLQDVKEDSDHADLFWAVRGAGASFGIVTQITVKIYPDMDEITHWTYEVTQGTPEQLSNAYDRFQDWAMDPELDRRFASTCIITRGRMAIERTFFGSVAEFNKLEKETDFPALIDVEGVRVNYETVKLNTFSGAVIHWLEDRALSIGGGIPAKFYVKSLILNADQQISPGLSTRLFEYINANTPPLALWFILSDLQGGRTNDADLAKSSSYGHRKGILIFQFYAIDANLLTPTFAPEIAEFIQGMYDIVLQGVPGLEARVYPGYVDPALGPDCEEIYWGDNAPRLRQLKRKYDPTNVFANPQSVRPAED